MLFGLISKISVRLFFKSSLEMKPSKSLSKHLKASGTVSYCYIIHCLILLIVSCSQSKLSSTVFFSRFSSLMTSKNYSYEIKPVLFLSIRAYNCSLIGTLSSRISASPLLSSEKDTIPSLSRSNLSNASLYCIFLTARASLICLQTVKAFSFDNLDC